MRLLKAKKTIIMRIAMLAGVATIAGCGVKSETPDCSDYFLGKPENTRFKVSDDGLAQHRESGTTFYRCTAGQAFRGGRCLGGPLALTKIDADLFAEEFSTKTKMSWRLPTSQELKYVAEASCQNPAVDTRVFPDLPIENLWSSSERRLQNDAFQCVMYTFNGSISCKHADNEPLPFLLVKAD